MTTSRTSTSRRGAGTKAGPAESGVSSPPPDSAPDLDPADALAQAEAASAELDSAPAPRRRGRPPGSRSRSKSSPNLAPRIKELLGSIGLMVTMVNAADGAAILEGAEPLADALDRLAKENPAVRRVLEAALTGGAMGAVVFALLPIVLKIAANHGAVPPVVAQLVGVTHGDPSSNGAGDVEPGAPRLVV